MKKIIILALALALVCVMLVGCGGHTHELTMVEANEATCEAAGNVEYYQCSGCELLFKDADGKEEIQDVVVPAIGHTLSHVDANAGDCTVAGNIEYYECDVCEKKFSDADATNEISSTTGALGAHKLTKYDAKESTCTVKGNIEYYKCDTCKLTFSDAAGTVKVTDVTTDLKDHSFKTVAAQAPTCISDGWEEYQVCENCEFKPSEIVTLTKSEEYHNWLDKEGLDPTCTEAGYTDYKQCEYCETKDGYADIPSTGHSYSAEWSKDEGFHWHDAICGCEGEFSDKAAHVFDDTGYCTAGCGQFNLEAWVCKHTEKTFVGAVPSTCKVQGTDAHYVCNDERCKVILKADGTTVVASLEELKLPLSTEHTYETIPAKTPTCTEGGYSEHQKCSVCGKEEGKTVLGATHTLVDVAEVASTCCTKGHSAYKDCTLCDYTEGYVEYELAGHTYDNACDPTCNIEECGATRVPPHVVNNEDDTICNECGENLNGEMPDDVIILPVVPITPSTPSVEEE